MVQPVVLIWIVFGVAIIAAVFFGYRAAKKRREAMATLAAQMGFAYSAADPGLMDRFEALGDPFNRGFGRRAANILTGTWDGRPTVAFDYSYKTQSGGKNNSTQTHLFSIVCVRSGLTMPALSVLPEGALTRAMGKLLGDDVQLESEDFNRAFRVTSPNRRFASDVLDPRMMHFLLTHGQEGFRFINGQAIRMRNGRIAPDDVPPAMAYLDAILDRIPEHVRRTLSGPSSPGSA